MSITLADITKMIEDLKPLPDPFNGATRLIMSADMFRKLAPVLDEHAKNPLVRLRIEIDIRPTMPPNYAAGFRPWRDGDDPAYRGLGDVMVWFLGPKTGAKPEPETHSS